MKKKALIIGGYYKAHVLASRLDKLAYQVKLINKNHQDCLELAELAYVPVICGDGTKEETLKKAGAEGVDLVIALMPTDAENLIACELVKASFNVKRSIALLRDPKKCDYFYQMGIDAVVCELQSILSIVEQGRWEETLMQASALDRTHFRLQEVAITNRSPANGKKLWELDLPRELLIICILRGEQEIIPRGDTSILSGDQLILIGSEADEARACETLSGKNMGLARNN